MGKFDSQRREKAAKKESLLAAALKDIAPGTPIREAIDDVIRGNTGALFVLCDEEQIQHVISGGFRVDVPFSPKLLYQLAKMDGAIIMDRNVERILWANVHLVPDSSLPSDETGTRHRSAERTARATRAVVITISEARDVVTVYIGDTKFQLEPIRWLWTKVSQAIATLETYRLRLDQVSHRLMARELAGTATLLDALVVIQRAEMANRMVAEIDRHQIELGTEGRITEMQLRELSVGIVPDRTAIVRDYLSADSSKDYVKVLDRLSRIRSERLLRLEDLEVLLGYDRDINPLDTPVTPRGYRVLGRIPGISPTLIDRIVTKFGSLDRIVQATPDELAEVSGLGPVRSDEIVRSLERMHDYFGQATR